MHKEIRKAVREAEKLGFHIRELRGHTWGRIECSCGSHTRVFSTGRNPEAGAKDILNWIDKHKGHVK
ncbi:hypothetical protein [Myceligenerans pegani]|uniref:HicA-like toxin n=1 Tax=Myceligenerans pegani TaxID=2776917 RepID=A0ABR9N282_9MICO|nr:hypothetical protein [Myceligenerans sp. TRM 65318]MBE1877759.1 hypothetical protein [Myceligenerans sp. TRM 65318]MBE3020030.1 hypothetical protein [Myceligenerans sp. TRM 65318]